MIYLPQQESERPTGRTSFGRIPQITLARKQLKRSCPDATRRAKNVEYRSRIGFLIGVQSRCGESGPGRRFTLRRRLAVQDQLLWSALVAAAGRERIRLSHGGTHDQVFPRICRGDRIGRLSGFLLCAFWLCGPSSRHSTRFARGKSSDAGSRRFGRPPSTRYEEPNPANGGESSFRDEDLPGRLLRLPW